MINIKKLTEELSTAGIANSGCGVTGVVWDVDGITEIQSRADVAAVLAAHNPDTPSWSDIRKQRDILLYGCDWTQISDSPISSSERELWTAYRQLLRDLPQEYANPEDVVFPTPPGGA